ncbi:hypothetical protein R70006_05043 [Paraburkholderia domus]|uniref:hypothetical protein n=1 Tax=Paraburkholderia domus TaxID=2793075 RepID=UPI001911C10B|nr:hypothetical protein [Paraburkholderia domus]MBK5051721.1 hypothetical protein [Burkholderia sp. R-70006]CAE6795280.1 hypothetical protein R70006_05043 [Paraburkholderia domus]
MNHSLTTACLTRDEILASLVSLGEDPTANRVAALHGRIDAAALPAGERAEVIRAAVDAERAKLDAGDPVQGKPLAYQVVKPGVKTGFDLQRPYVLKHHIPYAAAISGSDMGTQEGGDFYWKRTQAWGWSWSEAGRYSEEGAIWERDRLIGNGCAGVDLENANILEARLQVMMAIGRETESLPRAEYLALVKRVRALPDELFAAAVPDLAASGELTEASILAVSGLSEVGQRKELRLAASRAALMAAVPQLKQFASAVLFWKRTSGDPTLNDFLPIAENATREAGVSKQAEGLLLFAKIAVEWNIRTGDPTINHLLPVARNAIAIAEGQSGVLDQTMGGKPTVNDNAEGSMGKASNESGVPEGCTHYIPGLFGSVSFLQYRKTELIGYFAEYLDDQWKPMGTQPSASGITPCDIAEYYTGLPHQEFVSVMHAVWLADGNASDAAALLGIHEDRIWQMNAGQADSAFCSRPETWKPDDSRRYLRGEGCEVNAPVKVSASAESPSPDM